MTKAMKPYPIENWEIVDAVRAGLAPVSDSRRYVIGTYQGADIRTSYIMHNAAPHYVETNNSVYGLGKPAEKLLTGIENQAVAVVKKALLDNSDSLVAEAIGRAVMEDAAQLTAVTVIRALSKAHLLVK